MRKLFVGLLVLVLAVSIAVVPLTVASARLNVNPSVAVKGFTDSAASPLKGKPPKPPGKPPKVASNKWAVIIGISKYADPGANIYNPDKDAKEMARVLEKQYSFAEDHIRLLTNAEGTKDNVLAAITWLIDNENSTSIVVFFYCGHGGQTEDGVRGDPVDEDDGLDEYIVTYDMWGITDDYLASEFENIESTSFMLWFGSCHSGGISPDLNGDGRVIVAATEEDKVAYDYLLLRNTLFGYYYIDEGMKDGKADGYGPNGVSDKVVTVEEAFYYAKPLVTAERADQVPFIWDSDPTSDLYL